MRTWERVRATIWIEQLTESRKKCKRNERINKKKWESAVDTMDLESQYKYMTLSYKWSQKVRAIDELIKFLDEQAL